MQAVQLLLLMAGASKGLESICNATESICFGALGGPVYLRLMTNASGHDLAVYRGDTVVFNFRNSRSVFYKESNTTPVLQRWQFVPDNGTLIINPAERRDAGTYRAEVYEQSTGKGAGYYTVQLIMEAPVSDVGLSIRSMKCSSNGDSLQFSWSLDGRPVGEADADLSSDNQTILLKGDATGELTCTASNHVSRANTTITKQLCSG
ncbi:uncharacterized protein LOC134096184 [Sardina pilchardus]|uniref:uncharacterized protein LOC134096184 n=1 Tax=Sardina pilchardus TaxID=27697 RepID=UPI002E106552